MEDFRLTDIFAILSSLVVVITALAALFKKLRENLVTNMASLINVDNLNKNSSLYKTLEINNQILDQVNNINLKNNDGFEKINEQFVNINKSLLRLEIVSLMDHRTNDLANIYKLYEDYKENGGNSYIDKLMKDWEEGKYLSVDKMIDYMIEEKINKGK